VTAVIASYPSVIVPEINRKSRGKWELAGQYVAVQQECQPEGAFWNAKCPIRIENLDTCGLMGGMQEQPKAVFAESRGEIARLRCRDLFANLAGWCLERVGAPARLREFEFVDPGTDEIVYLSTGKRFSILSIGARRFYFDRISGKYDGTSAPASFVPWRVEFRD